MLITKNRQISGERADDDVPNFSNSFPSNSNDNVSIKPTVENSVTPDFEPIEKQRHFGILHYTINNRFKKIMLITIVNVIIVVGAFLLVFFTFLKVNGPFTDFLTTVSPHQPSTKATKTTSCSPTDETTFLFAYSTDLDSGTVNETLDYFIQHTMFPPYTTFAAVRFDMASGINFHFGKNFNSTIDYVRLNLPNPSLGFGNSNTGSDVLTMIDNFMANNQVPVCGSRLLILVKRYPNENDISDLVTKLREYHITPSILASNSPSGGNQPESLYDLATQTNGLCGFYEDEVMGKAVGFVPSFFNPYLIYAANPLVSGKDTKDLPVLHVATNNFFWFSMTIQNDGPISAVKTVLLKWTSNNSESGSLGKDGEIIHGFFFGNELNKTPVLTSLLFDLTLSYEYTDGNQRRLQIRVHSTDPKSIFPEPSPLCTPTSPTTFLFAYSNDFDYDTVSFVMQFFQTRTKDIAPHYTNFGIIRFDTTTQGDFTFGTDWSPINAYFKSHLPTPALSFSSKDTGSDVLKMVDRFLDNTKAPVCGSELFILTKRYPNSTDISQLVSKVRRYHSAVTFMASKKPSGGSSPETLYDLASRTNGLCGFDDDNKMGYAVEFFPTCFNPFLIYAVNPLVSGKGTVQLPPISIPSESFVGFWFSMTVQDSGPINVVQTALLSWSNTTVYNKGSHIGLKDSDSGDDVLYGNHISNWEDMNKAIYSMTLDYEYSDSKSRRLQIRVHGRSSNPVNYWPPFDS